MSRTQKNQLMPVGDIIPHDEYSLKIERRLKAGLTGEVYEGFLFKEDETQIHVAVKVMKTLEFPAARQFFMQESETLAFLMHLEDEANREQGITLKIAPIYYGRGEYKENPYLVMEFIEGKEILDLLKTAEGGKFSEERALTAAWHLYRTLDVMHRLLRKTYIDLKFENLWWVDSIDRTKSGQLKLTDFGTLEEIKPDDKQRRGVARDLLLAAVYFCKMVTGYTPSYSLGELREFDELKKQMQSTNISWGVKRELKRLLHRDPAQRPVDAASIAASLRTLVDFWTLDIQKVLDVARKALDRAQMAYDDAAEKGESISQKGLEAAHRARAALEILVLRFPDLDISQETERLQTILKSVNHLERGKNLLRGRSYSLAKEVFREGMIWEDDAAILRRWAYLAELGEDISPTDFETIQERAFNALDNLFPRGFWSEALKEFSSIQNILSPQLMGKLPKGLTYLQTEAELFSETTLADGFRNRDDFTAGEEHYLKAQALFEQLPLEYQKNIQENDLGDLKRSALDMLEKANEAKRKAEVDDGFLRAIEFFCKYGFNEDGTTIETRKNVEKAYRDALSLNYHGANMLHEVIYAALQNKNYQDAFSLAQIALLGNKIPKQLLDDLYLTASLYHAHEALSFPDGDQFIDELRRAFPYTQTEDVAKTCVDDLLARAERKARESQSAEMYAVLIQLYKETNPTRADQFSEAAASIKNKQSTERHARVDALVAEVKSLGALNLTEFSVAVTNSVLPYSLSEILCILHNTKERYQYMRQLLESAESLACLDGYSLDKICGLKSDLEREIVRLSKSVDENEKKYAEQYHEALAALNRWWIKIEPLWQWRSKSMEYFKESDASRAIYRQLYGEVMDFIAACYSLLQGASPTARLEEKLQEESLGEKQLLPEESRAAVHVLIENARQVLNSLGPDAWRAIQKEGAAAIQKAESFLENAREAFEQGQFPESQVLLEQSKPFAGETQEWKVLRAQVLQVALWKKWLRDHADTLNSSNYDAKILKDIRDYKVQNLPAHYWQSSSAEVYLKEMDKKLNEKIIPLLSDYNNPDNMLAETIREWLDVSCTTYFPIMHGMEWNGKTWLSSIYPMIVEKDIEGLSRTVHSVSLSNQELLADVNTSMWRLVVQQKEQAHREDAQKRENRKRTLVTSSVFVVIFCIVLAGFAFISRNFISRVVYGTYTPTASLTPTATPTLTPTPLPTSTQTLTPTPIPPSTYLVTDIAAIHPIVPLVVESAWVLMPENATAEPPITDENAWTKEISSDPNTKDEVFYSTQKQVRIFWETDQPLSGGYYAVFILDTKSKSGGIIPLQFQVLADRNPLNPFRGQPVAMFKSSAQKQQSDEWLPLGVYEVPAGQKLGIGTDVPPLQGDAFFALGKLLIVKINDPQKSLYDALPVGRILFALSDDSAANVLDIASKMPLPFHQGSVILDPNSWGGSFRSLPTDSLNGVSKKVAVQWDFPGVLQPGNYQILVWIPSAGATAQGEVILLLNGKALDKQPLPQVNQKDHAAVWWSVDIWNIPEQGAVSVQFLVDPSINIGGLLGIDAVALVKAE